MIGLEGAAKRSGLGTRVGVHNTARFDAVVNGIDAHRDIVGLQQGLQRHQNLLGEAFLNLRALCEKAHNPVYLGQADNLVSGNVGHAGGAIDGDKVMFAGTGEADVANFDHFFDTHLVLDVGDLGEVEVI